MNTTMWDLFSAAVKRTVDRLTPMAQTLRRTLAGDFQTTPRFQFHGEISLVLAHIGMLLIGFVTFLALNSSNQEHYNRNFASQAYGNRLLFISIAVGVVIYLSFRYPVLAWQLSLVLAVAATVMTRRWDSWSLHAALGLCVLLGVRLAMVTDRPYRFLVPGISAFGAALLGLERAIYGWAWVIPVTAVVVFMIDNHRRQSETTASKEAAEHAAAVAQKMAVTAQHEVVELGHREAVLRERTRIARDLHDVVAHHMSMVVVRAQTAEYRIADLSDEAKAELGEVAELARQSLTEVRELLAVLRADTEVALAPQPDLQEVPELLEAARTSGMVLEAELAEPLPNLSVAASQAAYRVIQEGLANVRRHAPGALAEVLVLAQGKVLVLSVRNGPAENFSLPDDAAPRADGELGASSAPVQVEVPVSVPVPGHGLLGLQERVHAVGGLLSCGETSDGGYLLFARLPIGEDAQ